MLWRGLLRDTEITGVAACSTVPALLPSLRQLLDSLEVPVVLIGPGVRTGVPLHVDNPREVGADRVVTALAAHELFGRGPDGTRPSGRRRRLRHLHQRRRRRTRRAVPRRRARARRRGQPRRARHPRRAAALGRADRARRTPSARTPSPRCSPGLVLGFAGLVDGLVGRIAAELVAQFGAAPVVVATGGLAPLVVDSCRSIGEREPDLTVHGLRLAFERHQCRRRHPPGAVRPPVGSHARD